MKKPALILILAITLTLLPFLIIFGPIILASGQTGRHTFLLGQDYSRLNRQQIIDRLSQDFPPKNLNLVFEDQNFELSPATFSAQINPQKTAQTLLFRDLNHGFLKYLKKFFSHQNYQLIVDYDQSLLDQKIASISAQIEKPFIPTELIVDKNSVTTKVGQLGRQVDSGFLSSAIKDSLTEWSSQPIIIPTSTIGFLPDSRQITKTESRAKKLLGKSLVLTGDFDDFILNDATLISFLDFSSDFNLDQIDSFVTNFSDNVQKDPVDAVFKFEQDTVTEFRPAQPGFTVKTDQLVSDIQSLVNQLIDQSDTNLDLAVAVNTIDPQVKTEDVNSLGIKQLLGSGVSTFKHSSTIRNFNVEKGASVINHILVAPGQKFSFIKNLGEVTLEAGYKKAYIIRAGRTELDVGGGICQVSTTLFRAMLNSGLDIVDRQPHAFRVSYYEEDRPPGYDATVFIPKPDLTFINDTPAHVLIQSIYDGVNKKLTYQIYGTDDGRKVTIDNYRQWGWQAAPPTNYIDDPTLEPGQLVQEEFAVPGINTSFDWKVTRGEEVINQKTFTSRYVPWPAVYRRGI